MNNVTSLSDAQLLAETRAQVRRSSEADAELLVLLAEIEVRELYVARAFPSMHDFCTKELGFSDGVAYLRIEAGRAARRYPSILEYVRDGRIHLSGLRVLIPHLNAENVEGLLAAAANKSKRDIEQLVAALAPKPPVPTRIRKLPTPPPPPPPAPPSMPMESTLLLEAAPPTPPRRADISPLSADTYSIQFTMDAELKRMLEQASELLGYQVRRGDVAGVLKRAMAVFIQKLMKDRFGATNKPRKTVKEAEAALKPTRHVPAPIRRELGERDDHQCAFVSEEGRRCEERHGVQFDHEDGWAIVPEHIADRMRLLCPKHNQYAADKKYGRAFMEAKRGRLFDPGQNAELEF